VKEALINLGRKGIRAVIVESAGFAEIGEEGKHRQDELLEAARGLGMRLLGPNCVGLVNTENELATIEVLDASLVPGPVAIIARAGFSVIFSWTTSLRWACKSARSPRWAIKSTWTRPIFSNISRTIPNPSHPHLSGRNSRRPASAPGFAAGVP